MLLLYYMKICTQCNQIKKLEEFYKQVAYKGRSERVQSICKQCVLLNRKSKYQNNEKFRTDTIERVKKWQQENWFKYKDKSLKYTYSISLDEYTDLLKKQGGLCMICKQPETRVVKQKTCFLHVDHNHENGIIRGLLCHACNTGIGLLKEDITILQEAINYLSSSS